MLEIKNVSKSFKDFTVLKDVNLTFDRGVYGLLSPNGAGKTTLIKMIVTLLHPDSGEILWNGENIASLDGSYRELVGYLPQTTAVTVNWSATFRRNSAITATIPRRSFSPIWRRSTALIPLSQRNAARSCSNG